MKYSDVRAIWNDMTQDSRDTGDIQFSDFTRAVDGVVGVGPPRTPVPSQPLDYLSDNKPLNWD